MSAQMVGIQQPFDKFFRDEGGKSNTLVFRVRVEGPLDLSLGNSRGEIPLLVEAVFEDGTLVPQQKDVIDVVGSTEKSNGEPCISLTSKLGGVTYRLKQVSKKLDDRKVCVRISAPDNVHLAPITSEGTLVYSKRKNKEQRLVQQEQERQDKERREADAVKQLMGVAAAAAAEASNSSSSKRLRQDGEGSSSINGAREKEKEEEEAADGEDAGGSGLSLEAEVAELRRRVARLERLVQEQKEMISSALLTSPPPSLGRSLSQSTWGIYPSFGGGGGGGGGGGTEEAGVIAAPPPTVQPQPVASLFGIPPDLRRESSSIGGGGEVEEGAGEAAATADVLPSAPSDLRRLTTTDFAGQPQLRRETSTSLMDLSSYNIEE